jgi:hypothetical protein
MIPSPTGSVYKEIFFQTDPTANAHNRSTTRSKRGF